jgi:dCTP deaminase
MFLSADEIGSEVDSGHIRIEPFLPALLKPASYVLRLGDEFCKWRQGTEPIIPWSENAAARHLVPEGIKKCYTISMGEFVLGATLERISIPRDLIGLVSTLSHVARFGISIHRDSFWINPGFGAKVPTKLTLEISSHNSSPVKLEAGVPVCHLAFARTLALRQNTLPLRDSIYEGDHAPSGPKLYEEFAEVLPDLTVGGHTE